jgi:DNA-binding NarL/FixJ family response regulator
MESVNPGRIKVVLVEDNVDFAHTVKDFLASEPDFELSALTHTESDFQSSIGAHLPDLALVDLGLSRPDSGADLIEWMAREYPVVRPVVMTVNENAVLRCYALGARGYVLKARLEILSDTLRKVHAGQLIIPPDVGEILVRQTVEQKRQYLQSQALRRLSDREKNILVMLQGGLRRESVAEKLGISFFTVRRHLQNVLEKTGRPSIRAVLEEYGEVLGDL